MQILKTQHERPTMETAGLYVKPLMHEWGTVNFGGRVSARLTFCQNTISKRSHWLSLDLDLFPTVWLYLLEMSALCQGPVWNQNNFQSSVGTCGQFDIHSSFFCCDGWTIGFSLWWRSDLMRWRHLKGLACLVEGLMIKFHFHSLAKRDSETTTPRPYSP